MVCVTIGLLMVMCGWLSTIQLLNSDTRAGAISRRFAAAVIGRIAGRKEEPAGEEGDEGDEEPAVNKSP